MKIRIWRRAPLLWCWHCPVCGKTWRNRESVAIRRPIQPTRYYPLWSTEVNVPRAWQRCVSAAYDHIKKYHVARIIDKTRVEGEEVSSTHYVARVIIERVDHIDTKRVGGLANSAVVDVAKRVVTQLANLTVRGDELVDILTKVPKHLELIDDIDAVDPERKGVR